MHLMNRLKNQAIIVLSHVSRSQQISKEQNLFLAKVYNSFLLEHYFTIKNTREYLTQPFTSISQSGKMISLGSAQF